MILLFRNQWVGLFTCMDGDKFHSFWNTCNREILFKVILEKRCSKCIQYLIHSKKNIVEVICTNLIIVNWYVFVLWTFHAGWNVFHCNCSHFFDMYIHIYSTVQFLGRIIIVMVIFFFPIQVCLRTCVYFSVWKLLWCKEWRFNKLTTCYLKFSVVTKLLKHNCGHFYFHHTQCLKHKSFWGFTEMASHSPLK